MKRTLLILLLLTKALELWAQGPYSIRGRVADSVSRESLDYITVALKSEKNEPIVTVLSAADGSFVFTRLSTGKYQVHLISAAHQSRVIPVDLAKDTDLGHVFLSAKSHSLQAVTVTADKPLVKMEIDRLSYDLQADPESKANSVLDMMRKVPMLALDSEDNILLKGSGQYRIMINGRPSAMLEKSPKDILRSMPASSIQSIEVITNPPAKYDGEGLAGIINIITIKKVDNGYNGNVNARYRFPQGGPNLGGSFNFKQGKWNVSANLGGNVFIRPLSTSYNERILHGNNPNYFRQDGAQEYENQNGYINTELAYEIDSLNLITGQVGYNLGAFEQTGFLLTRGRDQTMLLEAYDLNHENSGDRYGFDGGMNYQKGFKRNKQQLLTFSYRYLRLADQQDVLAQISNRFNYTQPDYTQFNEGGTTENTAQIDYVHPFGKTVMEAGIKGIFRDNFSNFAYSFLNAGGDYQFDPARSNYFDNTQNVLSLYNSWQLSWKGFGIKAGARLEETQIKARFLSTATHIDRDYLNLLPSLSLSKTLKGNNTLSFAFSKRIQRPGIWELNPYVDRTNPNLERTGNPELRPVVANSFQLAYTRTKKSNYNMSLNYVFINNANQYVMTFDPATRVNRVLPSNSGSYSSAGFMVDSSHPLNNRWNMNLSASLNFVRVQGEADGAEAENSGFTGNYVFSSSYRFDKGWRLSANANYLLTPYIVLQGEGIAIFFSGLTLNKDLLKEKLSLSAAVSNPFTRFQYFPNNMQTSSYSFVNNNRAFFRAYTFSMNYRFGNLKAQLARNKRGIKNDDSSEGNRP